MLRLQQRNQPTQFVKLAYSSVTLGRDANNDLAIDDESVSDFHAEISCDAHQYYVVDLLSANGTFLNDQRIATRVELKAWDRLRLGNFDLEVVDPNKHRPGDWALRPKESQVVSQFHPVSNNAIIGRDPECDIAIENAMLSRQHAKLMIEDEALKVIDLDSANGTFLNGNRVESAQLQAGDELRFDQLAFVVVGPSLTRVPETETDGLHTVIRSAVAPTSLSVSESEGPAPSLEPSTVSESDYSADAAKATRRPAVETRYLAPNKDDDATRFLGSESAIAQPARRCLASLIEKSDFLEHKNISLAEDSYSIGRGRDNRIVITNSSVSKQHAVVSLVKGSWEIKDLNSRNGTKINGANIASVKLQDGDSIELGEASFLFESDAIQESANFITELYTSQTLDTDATSVLTSSLNHTKAKPPIWVYSASVLLLALVVSAALYLWRSGLIFS